MPNKSPLFKILLLTISFNAVSQIQTSQKYLSIFDSIVKIENTSLYNGPIYKDRYRSFEDNHRFFLSPDFLKGSVIYGQQLYANLDLKYDLNEDLLVVKLEDSKSFVNLELISEKLDSFTINNHNFVNIDRLNIKDDLQVNGFLEILYSSNNIKLFIKYYKKVNKYVKNNQVVYTFPEKKAYYIFYNSSLTEIKNKKILKALFPDLNRKINEYYKTFSDLEKVNFDAFIVGLGKLIDNNITNTEL